MRIGIDVRKLRDYGIGTHIKNVILPAVSTDDQNQYVLFSDLADLQPEKPNTIWIAENSAKYSVREHINLGRKATAHKIDLFHSPHYTFPLTFNKLSIVTIHDLIQFKFPQFYAAWKIRAGMFLLKRAIQKAHLILTVSNTSRNDIVELYPAAESKIEVIYNRLDPEWSQPAPALDLSSLGIEKDFILYVGNFKKHKGLETLVDAFGLLKNPPQLVLVGKSRDTESDLLEKCFANSRIRVLGFAEGRMLRRLYTDALFFVFPSLYEGFGYPPLEAMSSGTPVLSSDTPALCEILADSVEFFKTGSVESLAAKLEMMIQNSGRRSELRTAGQQKARQYMTNDSPQKLLAIYRRFAQ
jgi:glycosyltransferase involved in cell wall biosynthesis